VIRRRIGVAAITLALFSGGASLPAQNVSPAATPAQKATRGSLLLADRALSVAARARGVAGAFDGVLAPNALLLYEGAPIVIGRGNIVTLLAAQPSLAAMRVQWLPVVAAVSNDGTFGATYGVTVIASLPIQADSALRFGKYISTWRWAQPGGWQMVGHVEMGLASAAVVIPPGLVARAPLSGDSLSGIGAPFARADAEFARMAAASGAPEAFGAFAAPDAATLPGTGEIVIGPAAIRARMLESPAATAKWEWHPVYSDGSAAGDLGFTIGEATITSAGSSDAFLSKYLTLWRRQPDGAIRFLVDGGNGR
jgi:ketosteroid isomerase-like protein